jgi:hypothetical protein
MTELKKLWELTDEEYESKFLISEKIVSRLTVLSSLIHHFSDGIWKTH